MPLVGENGMDGMFANCSVIAQRGGLERSLPRRYLPVLNELYDSVASGAEARQTIERGTMPNYRQELDAELKEVRELRSKAAEKVEAVS